MPPHLDLPDKLYFKIGEVSRLLEVPAHVLRYWEEEFPMLRPHKSQGGQRLYRRADVELISHIKDLLRNRKFTIAGARKQLVQERLKGRTPSEPPAEESDAASSEEVERLRLELEQAREERQAMARARAASSRRLETQRQVLFEVRKELADLLGSLDQDHRDLDDPS